LQASIFHILCPIPGEPQEEAINPLCYTQATPGLFSRSKVQPTADDSSNMHFKYKVHTTVNSISLY